MDDLRRRFATLDRVPVPDVWAEIQGRLDAQPAIDATIPTPLPDTVARPVRALRGTRSREASSRWMGLLVAAALILAALLAVGVVGQGLISKDPLLVPPSTIEASTSLPTNTPAPSQTPSSTSPTGLVVFVRENVTERTVAQLWVANPDGSQARVLLPALEGHAENPVWATDGTRLVFEWRPYGALFNHLFWTDASGANPREIDPTCIDPCATRDAAFSPDGRTLAFIRQTEAYGTDKPKAEGVVELLNLATGQITPLPSTATVGTIEPRSPAWSPESTRLAYTQETMGGGLGKEAGRSVLFVVDADGSNRRQVTPDDQRASDADWSPDGTRLSFTSYYQMGTPRAAFDAATDRWDVYTVALDGGGLNRLTSDGISSFARWTIDGRIRFLQSRRDAEGNDLPDGKRFLVVDSDGANVTRLDVPEVFVASPWTDWSVAP
jgi:Tol biopolymer transport system component